MPVFAGAQRHLALPPHINNAMPRHHGHESRIDDVGTGRGGRALTLTLTRTLTLIWQGKCEIIPMFTQNIKHVFVTFLASTKCAG